MMWMLFGLYHGQKGVYFVFKAAGSCGKGLPDFFIA